MVSQITTNQWPSLVIDKKNFSLLGAACARLWVEYPLVLA